MNIVCGFGGLRTDAATLTLAPSIPKGWTGYSFRVCTGGSILKVTVDQHSVKLQLLQGSGIRAVLYGKEINIDAVPAVFAMEEAQ